MLRFGQIRVIIVIERESKAHCYETMDSPLDYDPADIVLITAQDEETST